MADTSSVYSDRSHQSPSHQSRSHQSRSHQSRSRQSRSPADDPDSVTVFRSRSSATRHSRDGHETSSGFTLRALAIGLFNGILICFANTYFGLQAGFVNTMTLTSGLLAFAMFQVLKESVAIPFTPAENAVVIAVSGSFGTMPWTIGLIGIVPALEFLVKPDEGGPFKFEMWQLIVWSAGLSLLGVTIAPPLRKYFLFRQRLRFPVGTAAAAMLGMLYKDKIIAEKVKLDDTTHLGLKANSDTGNDDGQDDIQWRTNIKSLWIAFLFSSFWSLVSYFAPAIQNIPIFGHYLESQWGWALGGSPGYVAFGMLVEPSTSAWMAIGAIIGWAILSPIAKLKGWAPGPIFDWDTGVQGWVTWVALGVMLGDAIVHLTILSVKSFLEITVTMSRRWSSTSRGPRARVLSLRADEDQRGEEEDLLIPDDAFSPSSLPSEKPIPHKAIATWAVITLLLSITSMWILFRSFISPSAVFLAIALILPLSLVCIRAIGQTGNAAADSAGRFAQFIFSLLLPLSSPGALLANMAVASIAEAGAWQSAELMDEFKLGYLVSCPQSSLFHAQLLGSFAGAITASGVYKMYTRVYEIPSETLTIPIAHMWYSSTKLMYHSGLPPHVFSFALIAMILSAISSAAKSKLRNRYMDRLPQAIPMAIGMFIRPSFVLTRVLGGAIRYHFLHRRKTKELLIISVASGLILGDGVLSILKFGLKSAGVPHL